MSTLLNKSYLVKVSTKGGGGSKMPQILSTCFVHSPILENLSTWNMDVPLEDIYRNTILFVITYYKTRKTKI